jgi:hypothetical protein
MTTSWPSSSSLPARVRPTIPVPSIAIFMGFAVALSAVAAIVGFEIARRY